jgi:hypothetical protein
MAAPSWTSSSQNNSDQEHYDLSSSSGADGDSASAVTANKKEHRKISIIGGAAMAGTAVGLAVAGPFIALVGGITAATLATQDTKAGRVARSTGDTVLTAGDQIRGLDERHQIVAKTKWGLGSLFGRGKKIDEDKVKKVEGDDETSSDIHW